MPGGHLLPKRLMPIALDVLLHKHPNNNIPTSELTATLQSGISRLMQAVCRKLDEADIYG